MDFPAVVIPIPTRLETPDYTPETLALLEKLAPVERCFVEWCAAGESAAEAYRRASGEDNEHAKQYGYRLRWRVDVDAAIQACLKDRNFSARCDREWKIRKLKGIIELCEGHPLFANKAASSIKLLAELQGEITTKTEVHHHGVSERSNISVFISQIVAEAKGLNPGAAVGDSRQVVRTPPAVT